MDECKHGLSCFVDMNWIMLSNIYFNLYQCMFLSGYVEATHCYDYEYRTDDCDDE